MYRVFFVFICLGFFLGTRSFAFQKSTEDECERGDSQGNVLLEKNRNTVNKLQGFVKTEGTSLWTDGIIPYVIESATVSEEQVQLFMAGMDEWEEKTNIRFCEKTDDDVNYVILRSSAQDSPNAESYGNNADIGMEGGEQFLNILSWGDMDISTERLILHELGHTIGLRHEHQRPDRDEYIYVFLNNVKEGEVDNFDKRLDGFVYPKASYGLLDNETYDFSSVMHYHPQTSCSLDGDGRCEGNVIETKDPNMQRVIGQKFFISRLDALTVDFMYPDSNWVFIDGTFSEFGEGSFLSPYTAFKPINGIEPGSEVFIQPGQYLSKGVYKKKMTLKAPLGHVVLK